jgi:hypothetical protein
MPDERINAREITLRLLRHPWPTAAIDRMSVRVRCLGSDIAT